MTQALRLCADGRDCKAGTEADVPNAALPGLLKRVDVGRLSGEYKMHLLSRIMAFQEN